MTKLTWQESALLLTSTARDELQKHLSDLTAQLADLRLRKVEEALRGIVNLEAFEQKLLGNKPRKGKR